ncbi:MAG: hypothetical protein HY686_05720 [Chloroflexi bacterium]|nr:hypothetical protein [Chloroflexota bacterium]
MNRRLFLVALGALLLTLGALSCIRSSDQGQWYYGRTLVLNATKVRSYQEVGYQDQGAHYVIRPSQAGNTLAALRVRVLNRDAARVLILVDSKAAFLEDMKGNRYSLLNPLEQRQTVEQPPRSEGQVFPFLWGAFDLPQGYQVEGWLVFEVPQGFQAGQLVWEQADTIYARFRGR